MQRKIPAKITPNRNETMKLLLKISQKDNYSRLMLQLTQLKRRVLKSDLTTDELKCLITEGRDLLYVLQKKVMNGN